MSLDTIKEIKEINDFEGFEEKEIVKYDLDEGIYLGKRKRTKDSDKDVYRVLFPGHARNIPKIGLFLKWKGKMLCQKEPIFINNPNYFKYMRMISEAGI